MEIWKPIPEYPGYEASSLGQIRSFIRGSNGRILSQGRAGSDHRLHVVLGQGKQAYVHRLVLFAFVGPCPNGYQACHNDGNKDNNCAENLRWDTHSNNEKDKRAHGTSQRGEESAQAKLSEADVVAIRSIYETGKSMSEIAKIYGVRASTICKIVTGQRWVHVGGKIHKAGQDAGKHMPKGDDNYSHLHPEINRGEHSSTAILTEKDVRYIRAQFSAGVPAKELAIKFGVKTITIYHVIRRISWAYLD